MSELKNDIVKTAKLMTFSSLLEDIKKKLKEIKQEVKKNK